MKFYNKNKKAAMFGLDARIALAIFGALSVITGAALYSAIQNSKVIQMITQAKEIEKAVEQYMLDTGSLPPIESNSNLKIEGLVNNVANIKEWKGPYLDFNLNADEGWLQKGNITLALGYKDSANFNTLCTTDSTSCLVYIFVLFNHADNKLNNILLEKHIDGTENPGDTDSAGGFNYINNYIRQWSIFKTDIPFNPKNSPNTP